MCSIKHLEIICRNLALIPHPFSVSIYVVLFFVPVLFQGAEGVFSQQSQVNIWRFNKVSLTLLVRCCLIGPIYVYANYSPGLSRSLLYTAPISCSPILSPNLLDKNRLFSFSVLYVIVKTQIFYIHSTVSGASLHVFSHLQRLFQ